jgi:hypothetical protein
MDDVANYIDTGGFIYVGTSSGTNTVTWTPSPVLQAYVAGQKFIGVLGGTNTASATFNISSLGAKTVVITAGSTALSGGELASGNVVVFIYDGTNMRLIVPDTPNWNSWTPTLTAGGSMTYTSTSISYAKYIKRGKQVFFQASITGTTGVSAHPDLIMSLPFTTAGSSVCGGACLVHDSSNVAGTFTLSTSTTITINRYDAANWGLGASRGYTVQGFFEST